MHDCCPQCQLQLHSGGLEPLSFAPCYALPVTMSPSLEKNFTASILLILMLCASRGLSRTLTDDALLAEKHEQWMAEYGRTYMDTTSSSRMGRSFKYQNHTNAPTSMNWVDKGAVAHIKDQAQCGSCWAFSAVAAMEGIVQIKTGKLLTLSEQQVIDCNTKGMGCDGGLKELAFEYIVQNQGLTTELDYPYHATEGTCDSSKIRKIAAQISDYEEVTPNSETALLQAVSQQPVSVSIDGSSRDFAFYKTGVFTGECSTRHSHAVTAVGYGTSEDGTKYWLLKNSWGKRWGESGYIKIQRDVGFPEGLCGIAVNPSYPVHV